MAADVKPVMDNTVQAVNKSWDAVMNSFSSAFQQIGEYAPKVVAAVVVMVLGFIASKLVAQFATTLSEKLGLQTAADRSGLAGSMQHMGIKRTVPSIVGTIIFWLTLCVFLLASFNILGWTTASTAMQNVIAYIPQLLIATVVVVVGLLVATLLRGLVATSADRVGISYAEHLANACYYVLALLTIVAAAQYLGLKFALLEQLILISFGALAVGFGLAFGLGGRDVMGGILAGYYLRQRLQSGDHVTLGSMEGTVREVGPVATVIETDEDGLMNRHSVPNVKMLNEAVR